MLVIGTSPLQHLRQLGDIDRDAPGLIASEEVRRRASAGLLLVVHIRERVAASVLHDETGVVHLVDGPRRREAASGHAPALRLRSYAASIARFAAWMGRQAF